MTEEKSPCLQAETTNLKNELTGAVIGLVRAAESSPVVTKDTYRLIFASLSASSANACIDSGSIIKQIEAVRNEKFRLAPDCSVCAAPCGRTSDYDLGQLQKESGDTRAVKLLILYGIREMAALAGKAAAAGHFDDEVNDYFLEAVLRIGMDESYSALLETAMKIGEVSRKCAVLLKL